MPRQGRAARDALVRCRQWISSRQPELEEAPLIDPTPPSLSLEPIREADFEVVATLARRIWREHYTTIISSEQIEYMIDGRFTTENLRRYVAADDRWLDVLRLDREPVGYCSFALTATPAEMKLEQLYLLPVHHGLGLGRFMLDHVERQCRLRGCGRLMLQVNKRNEKAIRAYRRAGFQHREAVVVDIGNGFVMDDNIMEKILQG
jgi:diamine N-acetyltransferase